MRAAVQTTITLTGELRNIETHQTATVGELKHYISLYLSVTNMVFNYDGDVDTLSGYTVDGSQKVSAGISVAIALAPLIGMVYYLMCTH